MNIISKSKNVTSYKLQVTRSRGFTLLELLVSVGILGILIGFSSWAYLSVQRNSDLSNHTAQLTVTIRQVQALAMSGQTGLSFREHELERIMTRIVSVSKVQAAGAGAPPPTSEPVDMGLHFETMSYSIFYGSVYNPEDSRNITTNLPINITILVDLPTSELIFAAKTGEVVNYDSGHDTITISHSDGQSHVLTVNKWGVVEID